MQSADLDDVVRVAQVSFPDHPEDRACFENRLTLYPQGCLVLDEPPGGVAGYLIAYPWMWGSAPALNTQIGPLPEEPELIYLHDLALAPEVRGRGATTPALDRLVDQTRQAGLDRIALVAVNNAAPFWQRHGFAPAQVPGMEAKLASYGAGACYMTRQLLGGWSPT